MSSYTPVYSRPYEDGFVNAPPYKTPITDEVLNSYDRAIENIEDYLKDNPIDQPAIGGGEVDSTDLVVTNSISMGRKEDTTIGVGSVAVGDDVTASGEYSFAGGQGTTASGALSHAEGQGSVASGPMSHAEGQGTVASGAFSHAEGLNTTVSAPWSHSEGEGTIAYGPHQHVQGKYNIRDSSGSYAHIVGNGTPVESKNAHTLDWSGNAWYSGTVESAGIILSDNTDKSKRYKIQISDGQLVAEQIR